MPSRHMSQSAQRGHAMKKTDFTYIGKRHPRMDVQQQLETTRATIRQLKEKNIPV